MLSRGVGGWFIYRSNQLVIFKSSDGSNRCTINITMSSWKKEPVNHVSLNGIIYMLNTTA